MYRFGRRLIALFLVIHPLLLSTSPLNAAAPPSTPDRHALPVFAAARDTTVAADSHRSTWGTALEIGARQPTTSPISLEDLPIITTTTVLTAVIVPIEAINQPTPTATPPPSPTPIPTPLPTPDPSSPLLDREFSDVLEGTIIANRTEASVSFFVEGELYRLAPLRSFGLDLPRETAVLNLYSCDADTPQTTEGCFWNPFLIVPDGFYEISNLASGNRFELTVREAGAPPENQIWVQNRTGAREMVVFDGEALEIPPSTVKEFSSGGNPVVTLHARNCLSLGSESVCEWRPINLEPGFYYALQEVDYPGTLPESQVNGIEIRPLVASDGATIESPQQLVCQLQIPVLNVRSGPGLEFLVVGQTTGAETDAGGVVVVGRDATNQWLAVDQRIAPGGWVIAGDQFMTCDGAIGTLPVAEITDGRLAPVTEAVAAEESTEAEGASAEGASAEDETPEEQAIAVPPGQALLIVNSAFEHDLRFTLAPEEYDMKQGDILYIPINPGRIQFSVSTPWSGGLSGNAEIVLEEGQTFVMYLYFTPDPDDSGEWDMQYQ